MSSNSSGGTRVGLLTNQPVRRGTSRARCCCYAAAAGVCIFLVVPAAVFFGLVAAFKPPALSLEMLTSGTLNVPLGNTSVWVEFAAYPTDAPNLVDFAHAHWYTWHWTFSDGATAMGHSPSIGHAFALSGNDSGSPAAPVVISASVAATQLIFGAEQSAEVSGNVSWVMFSAAAVFMTNNSVLNCSSLTPTLLIDQSLLPESSIVAGSVLAGSDCGGYILIAQGPPVPQSDGTTVAIQTVGGGLTDLVESADLFDVDVSYDADSVNANLFVPGNLTFINGSSVGNDSSAGAFEYEQFSSDHLLDRDTERQARTSDTPSRGERAVHANAEFFKQIPITVDVPKIKVPFDKPSPIYAFIQPSMNLLLALRLSISIRLREYSSITFVASVAGRYGVEVGVTAEWQGSVDYNYEYFAPIVLARFPLPIVEVPCELKFGMHGNLTLTAEESITESVTLSRGFIATMGGTLNANGDFTSIWNYVPSPWILTEKAFEPTCKFSAELKFTPYLALTPVYVEYPRVELALPYGPVAALDYNAANKHQECWCGLYPEDDGRARLGIEMEMEVDLNFYLTSEIYARAQLWKPEPVTVYETCLAIGAAPCGKCDRPPAPPPPPPIIPAPPPPVVAAPPPPTPPPPTPPPPVVASPPPPPPPVVPYGTCDGLPSDQGTPCGCNPSNPTGNGCCTMKYLWPYTGQAVCTQIYCSPADSTCLMSCTSQSYCGAGSACVCLFPGLAHCVPSPDTCGGTSCDSCPATRPWF